MSDDMVERISRLLQTEFYAHCAVEKWANPDRVFGLVARAAIAAMREPTETMQEAGEAVEDTEHGGHSGWVTDVWQAMIDAALEKKP